MFAVDEVAPSRDLGADLADARIQECFEQVHSQIEALQTERLELLARLEHHRVYERDGHLSITAWLVARLHLSWAAAKELVAAARGLEHMPETAKALQGGQISSSALKALVRAREVDPEAFTRSEAALADAARTQPIGGLNRVLARWSQLAEAGRYRDPAQRRWAQRSFYASLTLQGMTRTDGDLIPEVAESLLTALSAVIDAELPYRGLDERTQAQRRHDALGVICRGFLDSTDRPLVGGERPHVSLTVALETLQGDQGIAELDHSGPVGPRTAQMLSCDASVRRVVLGPASEPLDVGRATSVVSAALRRAVITRDSDCAFPTCDRPKSWCDVHHVVHWAEGGTTALGNLVLLCRRHHGLVHARGGFSLQMVNGRPVFKRPDGSVLLDRGPPGG
jgi:Domain of unknown function (DUF222)/HNH endonuclease